jgi:lysophospholipase L1-like esterase
MKVNEVGVDAAAGESFSRFAVSPSRHFPLLFFALCLVLVSLSCGGGKRITADKIMWKGEVQDVDEQGTDERRNEPVIYVALGDSTGAGVGARKGGGYVARVFERIERVRPTSRLVNLCVSGATTADVLRSQVARVAEARPTLITLGIGINDVTRNLPVEQFGRNYEQVIVALKEKAPDAAIVVTGMPDISFAPAVPEFLRDEARRRIVAYNERVRDIAAHHQLRFIDAYEKSHQLIPQHPEFFSPDNFHPSDEGYELWAVLMWPTIKEAIGASE